MNPNPFLSQLYAFIFTILAGLLTAFLFDCYRVIRGIARPKKLLTSIGDLLYCFLITVMVFILLVYGSWGEVRLYVFLGWGFGIYVYEKIFSSVVLTILIKFSRMLLKVFRLIWKISCKICLLLKKIFCFLKSIILKLCMLFLFPVRFCRRIFGGIKRQIHYPLIYLSKEKKKK